MKRNYFLLILVLGALSALSPFSIDMYLPAFPAIARSLNTSISGIQLSLTSFFLGISVGQLFYGPLVDRFGRTIPIYIGLALYTVASLGCAFVLSSKDLVMLRFIQALGSCAGMVASRALVKDLFPVNELAQVFSLLMLVIAVSPLLAPSIGAYVSLAFGWHAIFVVLAFISAFIFIMCLTLLPSGRPPDSSISLRFLPVISSYITVLSQPQFQSYALTGSIAGAAMYAYLSGSPAVYINIFKVDQRTYGWIFAIIAGGLIGSSQLNSMLLRRYNSETIIRTALMLQATIGIALVLFCTSSRPWQAGVTVLIFLFLCCQGFSFPNASALSLAPFTEKAGSASALMGFLQMAFGALASAGVSLFQGNTAFSMAAIMEGCSISGCLWLYFSTRSLKVRSQTELPPINEKRKSLRR